MKTISEEDNLSESAHSILDEQANKLFDLCNVRNSEYVFREDLQHLNDFIPNLASADAEKLFFHTENSQKLNKLDRIGFVEAIKPFLLRANHTQNLPKKQRKHVRDIPKNMFKTISLDNDDSKQKLPVDLQRKPKLSISLDDNLGDANFINSKNPKSISKPTENKPEMYNYVNLDDFDNPAIISPFYEKAFHFDDDHKKKSAIRSKTEDEEIERRNHHEVEEVLRRSKSDLLVDDVKKPQRPSDFGPILVFDHPVPEDIRSPDRIFKIVFVGDSAVGKTCFLHRFCHNRFKPLFNATIGVDFTIKSIKLRDRLVAVQLWDTAGQERFRSITKQYFRKADSVVLMYDVTSEQSFLNVRNWIESVRMGVDDGCVMCLVGNKVDLASNDLARKVSYSDGKRIAQEFDMLFFETSAYTGLGINDCMRAVAIRLQQREDEQLEEALKLEMIVQNARKTLGLFVTTAELPHLTPEQSGDPSFGYDCNFDLACRWSSTGNTPNHWLHAKGEPEALIWLAATGTMTAPRQPFTLIELRGQPSDSLTSDVISCQNDNGILSFTYWTIGNADLEICLLDEFKKRFNCTGMLQSHVQPKTVSLNIPSSPHPFYISLIPNMETGVLVLDDIQYHATFCSIPKSRPDQSLIPWTMPTQPVVTSTTSVFPVFTTKIEPTFPTVPPTTSAQPSTTASATPAVITNPKTEPPFDLYIVGNRTQPLFDRRRGKLVDDVNLLLCDFGGEFECLWGPETGKWAIIEKGAIPSMESDQKTGPVYPAALIIQGTALLTSDPIRCQTGSGSLFFRYWSNGNILLQACALGYQEDSTNYQCAEEIGHHNLANGTLAIFNFNESITEPFTLNIVPMWEKNAQNMYLIVDEIAYMGNCSTQTSSPPPLILPEVLQTKIPTIRPSALSRFVTPSPLPEPSVMPPQTLSTALTTKATTPRYEFLTTTAIPFDYCTILNCDFNENACNYLNHGLTKVPWTLRNKGYGFPLSKATDIRPTASNKQFVSTLLGPGDFAILESPVFNVTQGVNVLLFQYYRPTHATTIRLCLGTTTTKPLRTVASFTQCPPILRSLTTKTAYKWNNVHISIPPGTTHFYLVAHNLDKSSEKSAIALDNIRVAICDPQAFDSESNLKKI
uniref:MAM domain-containing protein n=1 Tax=Panagrolaimus sp. JU765 TaxID=591449 RepID=A0AC34PUQ3_9BILA